MVSGDNNPPYRWSSSLHQFKFSLSTNEDAIDVFSGVFITPKTHVFIFWFILCQRIPVNVTHWAFKPLSFCQKCWYRVGFGCTTFTFTCFQIRMKTSRMARHWWAFKRKNLTLSLWNAVHQFETGQPNSSLAFPALTPSLSSADGLTVVGCY